MGGEAMKILVTGGAGYIGSVLVPMLLRRDHHVRVLDTLMYGGHSLLPHFRHPNFEFTKGDVRDPQTVEKAVADCDLVIHLAAIVGFPACRKYPDLAQTINVEGTKVVGRAAGPDRLILLGSTGSNYGALVDEVCTEDTPLNPLSLYGKTKTTAEQYLRENNRTIAYRFATAFGSSPRLRLDLLVNDFVHKAVSESYLVVYEPHFMRTFIHVHDIARSFLFAIENAERMAGQVYNIGSAEMNYSKAEVCEKIKEQIPYYLHYADVGEDQDKRNYHVSYEKINQLGYETTISLEEGISELVRTMAIVDGENPYTNV
jgi:nucleoside-diphosphate-sugar epimerase